jgi:hypothetical protein
MLASVAETHGYKRGWVAYKFKEKFGAWPKRKYPPLVEPTAECLAWVRSRQIAFARSSQRKDQ